MNEQKRYYSVGFMYRDNGEIFGSGAYMTEDEKDRIKTMLDRYNEAGAIDSSSVREPSVVNQDFQILVSEINEALKNETTDGEAESRCPNCDRVWSDDILVPVEEVKNLLQRVAPGEPMPSGECPACGGLCQPVAE